jgi:glycosyltransferase involved in cell wall biosynthesis
VSETAAMVDVRMPARGVAPYIGEAIDSVLAQTLPSWTLLVSENGAPGGKLAEQLTPYLADSRIRYRSIGADVSAATNHTRLITDGRAPYVGILHDDDRWHPHFLERRVAFMEAHPACGFVFSGNYEIDSKSDRIRGSDIVLAEGVYEPKAFVPMLLRRTVIGFPTVVVRRSAYEAVGPAFDEETISYDFEMWLRLAIRFPVGYLAVRDADYRIHDSQATMTIGRRGEQRLRSLEQANALLATAPGIDVDRRWLRRRKAGAHLTAALDDLQEADRPAARAHIRAGLKTYPAVAFDPRMPAALAGLVLGRRGIQAFARLRYAVLRRQLRVHIRR